VYGFFCHDGASPSGYPGWLSQCHERLDLTSADGYWRIPSPTPCAPRPHTIQHQDHPGARQYSSNLHGTTSPVHAQDPGTGLCLLVPWHATDDVGRPCETLSDLPPTLRAIYRTRGYRCQRAYPRPSCSLSQSGKENAGLLNPTPSPTPHPLFAMEETGRPSGCGRRRVSLALAIRELNGQMGLAHSRVALAHAVCVDL
jgi:hypothetical protein